MMRYVCTDCDWTTDSEDSLVDDLGSLAINHHVASGHSVELADSRRP